MDIIISDKVVTTLVDTILHTCEGVLHSDHLTEGEKLLRLAKLVELHRHLHFHHLAESDFGYSVNLIYNALLEASDSYKETPTPALERRIAALQGAWHAVMDAWVEADTFVEVEVVGHNCE